MKAFIAGGTGFVGVHLANHLLAAGHRVTVMGQSARRPPGLAAGVTVTAGDGTVPGPWQKEAAGAGLVINLAGASIFTRWTPAAKRVIRESRILTTRHLVDALPADASGVTLFSTSAVGYYGFRGDEELDEEAPPGDDFLARLCVEWEGEARAAADRGARVIVTRFGIVLGRGGGALGMMLPLFRWGIGGPLGSGRQWFSWIHMTDLLEAYVFLLGREDARGTYNLCAPGAVRNRTLARDLGRALHRPALLPVPGFALRILKGEFGNVLLEGQRVAPRRLAAAGYRFAYPELPAALAEVAG